MACFHANSGDRGQVDVEKRVYRLACSTWSTIETVLRRAAASAGEGEMMPLPKSALATEHEPRYQVRRQGVAENMSPRKASFCYLSGLVTTI